MTTSLTLRDTNIDHYMAEIRKIPLLSHDEEYQLARRYRDEGDLSAAHRLVVANLRFVVKIAHEYRNYGLRLLDLIQEGNIGLMFAVKKFDPDKGYRLISYAVWWIRAQIQSFILKSWSLVKVGTGRVRRKLFFKLRSERNRAELEAADGESASAHTLAERLGVEEAEVEEMELRLAARDFSLDAQISDGARATHIDFLSSSEHNQEEALGDLQEQALVQHKVHEVMDELNAKERYIVEKRLMSHAPQTLQEIGDTFNVSRERVRQLENRVIAKLRDKLKDARSFRGGQASAPA